MDNALLNDGCVLAIWRQARITASARGIYHNVTRIYLRYARYGR